MSHNFDLQLQQRKLSAVAADKPEQRLNSVPPAVSLEWRQPLARKDDESAGVLEPCLHQLVEMQAHRTPDATAVEFGRCSLSYGQLDSRANVIASRLRESGVGPDTLVGLSIDRSPEMFVGLLAILKAGGAYVPIDETNPIERLRAILSEVRPRVVLTQRRQSHRFSEWPVLFVDDQPDTTDFDAADPGAAVTPDHLAYVIFTSGSTGTPKGVLVAQRSVVNHGLEMARYFQLCPSDRVLQFAALSFDVAAEEIFPTWISGATVVPWPASPGLTTVSALINFVATQRVTVLNLPAPFWQEWMTDLDRLPVPSSVRLIIVGTDKVSPENFLKCRRHVGPHVRLCNAYGVTEATITTTIFEPGVEYDPGNAESVPIGRAVANAETYVLDDSFNPVPTSVTGELYIGGSCLARGYLNRPDLTAERFIANANGARIYRTGDLVRRLPDGNLEFLGRIDDQVKVRGVRIELGEIECALAQIDGVRSAVAVVREVHPGDKRLIAYAVCEPTAGWTAARLRSRMREKLPDYMMPSAIVLLEKFPLTAGGKIDRTALPWLEGNAKLQAEPFVACRTPTERQLADIWQEVLSINSIGLRDNFFDLGGDSLIGMRLMAQIERKFRRNIPLSALFDAPTIELMAKLISDDCRERYWPSLVPLQANGSKPPFFWVYGDLSNAFLASYLGADQPLYGFRHPGSDGRPARYKTIKEMAGHFLGEIRRVRGHGPYFLGGYCIGAVVAFEIAQILRRQGETVPLLVMMAPDRPARIKLESSPNVTPAYWQGRGMPEPLKVSKGNDLRERLKTFTKLSAHEKVRHAFRSATSRFNRFIDRAIVSPATRTGSDVVCRTCVALGARVPIRFREFYINSIYEQAARGYVAEPYNGLVILFKPFQDPVDLVSWQTLVGTGLEIHHVPGNHADVMSNRDHVKIWADVLRRYLQQLS